MIEQLKNLLDECRYMAAGGDPIWLADVQALEWALKQIEEKSCTNCTYECSCSWKPAADKAYCESWSPDIRMGCVAYGIKLNEQTERKMVDLMEEGIKKEECIKKQEEPERLIKEIHEIQKVIDHRTAVEKKVIKLIGECRFQEAMDLLSEELDAGC